MCSCLYMYVYCPPQQQVWFTDCSCIVYRMDRITIREREALEKEEEEREKENKKQEVLRKNESKRVRRGGRGWEESGKEGGGK